VEVEVKVDRKWKVKWNLKSRWSKGRPEVDVKVDRKWK
jgi:hypothetical protein